MWSIRSECSRTLPAASELHPQYCFSCGPYIISEPDPAYILTFVYRVPEFLCIQDVSVSIRRCGVQGR